MAQPVLKEASEHGAGSAPGQAERRRDPRRRMATRVALKTDRAIFFMEARDISRKGICLESEVGIEVGTRCRLIPFFDDVARLFEADGTVVRVGEMTRERPGQGPMAQVGIAFDALSVAEEEALLAILRQADGAPAKPTLVRM